MTGQAAAKPRVRRRWVRVVNGISVALMVVGATACLLMLLHVVLDVAGRVFRNQPLTGTLEITRYWWMLTLVFMGLGYAQLKNQNIRATVITELLSPNWQRIAEAGAVVLL